MVTQGKQEHSSIFIVIPSPNLYLQSLILTSFPKSTAFLSFIPSKPRYSQYTVGPMDQKKFL